MSLNKKKLLEKIIEKLEEDLALFAKAARASHLEATHEQNKAENKYDTRGLEAAYLAGGQARKVQEVEQSLEKFQMLNPGDFTGKGADVGALVSVDMAGDIGWFFIGPCHGGLEVLFSKKEVTVLTPESPLGSLLIGRKAGEFVMFGNGRSVATYKIKELL
ncbi:MAG: elongation factor GreAB [Verrucomicrobiales bacterium]|nr:elongation factor GreAB [Verrucomicrobiales bacterium]MDB6131287.1 elongation factor GreAB [Verrucomicrobiales bacterium]